MSCPQAVRASNEGRGPKSGITCAPPSVWRMLRGAVPSFCQGLATCEAAPSVPSSEARARPPRSGHFLRLPGDDSAGDSQAITLLRRSACPEEAACPLECFPFPAPRIAGEGRGCSGCTARSRGAAPARPPAPEGRVPGPEASETVDSIRATADSMSSETLGPGSRVQLWSGPTPGPWCPFWKMSVVFSTLTSRGRGEEKAIKVTSAAVSRGLARRQAQST